MGFVTFLSFLSSNNHYTIGCLRTPNGGSRCVFQQRDVFNIVSIKQGFHLFFLQRHAVDNKQGRTVRIYGGNTTDDVLVGPLAHVYAQTGSQTFKALYDASRQADFATDSVAFDDSIRTGTSFPRKSLITGNHHITKQLTVIYHNNLQ